MKPCEVTRTIRGLSVEGRYEKVRGVTALSVRNRITPSPQPRS